MKTYLHISYQFMFSNNVKHGFGNASLMFDNFPSKNQATDEIRKNLIDSGVTEDVSIVILNITKMNKEEFDLWTDQ